MCALGGREITHINTIKASLAAITQVYEGLLRVPWCKYADARRLTPTRLALGIFHGIYDWRCVLPRYHNRISLGFSNVIGPGRCDVTLDSDWLMGWCDVKVEG